jgi:hypothetical protein
MLHFMMCLPLLLALSFEGPPPRPDFSGTWRANWAKSKLQIEQPDSTVFTIDHRDPEFLLTRTHTFQGKSDTFSIRLSTDGTEVVVKEASHTMRAPHLGGP